MVDDTISRRVAIDALIAHANHDGAYGYIDAKEAEDTLKALPTAEPRWIPVTERVPEKNTLALITTSKGIVVQVMFFGENMNGHMVWRSFGGEYVYWDEEVTAWMPLPTPWKGESDG